ncbi:hypothetical protein ALTERO38_50463 [Alteromonas sp. 38]|nr:hypothetical protein ALTER154_80806 [Alteromonas sp. 154]VXB33965.1 hypothetical protein ALTERO38_50463 [Alteromonas sp. 38]
MSKFAAYANLLIDISNLDANSGNLAMLYKLFKIHGR